MAVALLILVKLCGFGSSIVEYDPDNECVMDMIRPRIFASRIYAAVVELAYRFHVRS